MNALAFHDFGFEGQTVRAMERAGAPWFVAQDVCACLEIGNHRDAVAKLDEDEKGVGITDTLGGPQEMLIVSESGVYGLVFRSRKDAARRFRRWVTSEVLPALRHSGRYLMAADEEDTELLSLDTPDDIDRVRVKMGLVREARYVYGRQTARQLWKRIGLPDVRTLPGEQIGWTADDVSPVLREWIDARCETDPDFRARSEPLYKDYCSWCAEIDEEPPSRQGFTKQMKRMKFRRFHSNGGWIKGVRLKN